MQKRSFMRAVALLVVTAACAFASGTVWSEVKDNVAYVHHDSAEFNCCPVMVFTIEQSADTIDIYEQDTLPSCWCICSYDLEHTLEGLESGTYLARVWESASPGEEFSLAGTTSFTILAKVSPSSISTWMSECYDAPGTHEDPGSGISLKSTPLVQQSAEIRFTLRERISVRLEIYDALGRKVRTLEAGLLDAGEHAMIWDTRADSGVQVSRGTYFIRLVAGTSVRTLPLLVLK